MYINAKEINLEDLKLVKKDGRYYLSATYVFDDGSNKYVMEVPRISLPIRCGAPDINESTMTLGGYGEAFINLGFGDLEMHKFNGHHYTITTIQEELTLEEIEKRLGYKVKIVTKK